jgi:HEPN domain-containing protein
MSAPEADICRKAELWLAYADEDLRLARHGLSMTVAVPPYRLIASHAQQCAEKCLKAYLVLRRTGFPYMHNLGHLLDLCATTAPWVESLRDADELTPFAITARYPGEDDAVTRPETLRALEIAERVRETVRETIRQMGVMPPPETPA